MSDFLKRVGMAQAELKAQKFCINAIKITIKTCVL